MADVSPQKHDRGTWIPRGAWRVLVANQAQRLENDLRALDPPLASGPATLISESISRARNAADRPSGMLERMRDWWSGARAETAWSALHDAGQRLMQAQPTRAVSAQIPEIAAAVASSLKADDPRTNAYIKELLEYETKSPDDLSANDLAAIARIRRTADSASDAAHGNVRSYRNLLMLLGVGLTIMLVALAVVHAFVPGFLSLTAPHGQDAPELWAIEVLGAFGGAIAGVLALARLGGFTGPYSLPAYQALLRMPMAGAVSVFGIVLLQSNALGALKPVAGLELYAYAILFGYAQEPLLRMIDRRAENILEPARGKDDPGASAVNAASALGGGKA